MCAYIDKLLFLSVVLHSNNIYGRIKQVPACDMQLFSVAPCISQAKQTQRKDYLPD